MSLILSGSDGLSDVDGSASTPAIRGTDANTGIFFPAADTAAISTGGSERVRVDSSGNVGIGTSSPGYRLTVGNGGADTRSVFNPNNAFAIGVSNGASFAGWIGGSGAADTMVFSSSGGTERMRITSGGDLQFNSGYGSVATAYGCRAWVNFNGTGTVAIRANGNVSSITDNGTGDYTVNFTNAMTDANYSVVALGEWTSGVTNVTFATTSTLNSTSGARIRYMNTSSAVNDTPVATVAVFR